VDVTSKTKALQQALFTVSNGIICASEMRTVIVLCPFLIKKIFSHSLKLTLEIFRKVCCFLFPFSLFSHNAAARTMVAQTLHKCSMEKILFKRSEDFKGNIPHLSLLIFHIIDFSYYWFFILLIFHIIDFSYY
jgi:hypothetical protein